MSSRLSYTAPPQSALPYPTFYPSATVGHPSPGTSPTSTGYNSYVYVTTSGGPINNNNTTNGGGGTHVSSTGQLLFGGNAMGSGAYQQVQQIHPRAMRTQQQHTQTYVTAAPASSASSAAPGAAGRPPHFTANPNAGFTSAAAAVFRRGSSASSIDSATNTVTSATMGGHAGNMSTSSSSSFNSTTPHGIPARATWGRSPQQQMQMQGAMQLQHQHHQQQQQQQGANGGGADMENIRPQFRSKIVCELTCRHCEAVVCRRGMKAILLADMNIELFSTDVPPHGVQLVNNDYQTRNCYCRIRDVACLGCGNVIGYHVTQPCEPCMEACNNGHFWMFHISEVSYADRLDNGGNRALLWAQLPKADTDMGRSDDYDTMCR